MKIKLIALAVALFFSATLARADQFGTLTSGSFSAIYEPGDFRYSGRFDGRLESNFDVSFEGGGSEDGTPFPYAFSPFEPGQRVNFDGGAFGLDFGGSITIDGQSYSFTTDLNDPLSFGGIEFVAGSAATPTDGSQGVVLRAPFSVVATAYIFELDELFTLRGKGTAELFLSLRQSDGFYQFDQITYTAAVPEPTTMILLGTGLAGIAAQYRRRFKK